MTYFFGGKIEFETQHIIIAESETTSDAIRLKGFGIVGVILPAALTSTSMTFEGSQLSDSGFVPLYNTDGDLLSTAVAASRAVLFVPGDLVGINYAKLVMGSSEDAEREITVISRAFV